MWSRTRLGALAGSAGGLAMVLAGLALQPLVGLPTLPELLQDRLVKLTPGALFGLLIDRLQYAGRPLLYSSLLLLELVVLVAVGALAVTLAEGRGADALPPPRHRPVWRIVILAILLWLGIGLIILPLAGLGPFAAGSRFASGVMVWGYFLESLLFSAVTWLVLAALAGPVAPALQPEQSAPDLRRRGVAAGIALAAVATLGGTAFWRYQGEQVSAATTGGPSPADASLPASSTGGSGTPAPPAPATVPVRVYGSAASTTATTTLAAPGTAGGVAVGSTAAAIGSTPLLTPAGAFYVVSKNLDDPVVKADSWQLSIKGLVKAPFTLSYQALQALPSVDQYRTLACISNDVGGSLMSNALWRGVPLAALLDHAGANPNAAFVLFGSVDGYTESLAMAVARQPTTLIAYQMNGAPLLAKHGFPARIILAGRYGMKNPKWLTEVTVSAADKPGFWEQQGWDEQAVVRTTSRIDGPQDGASIPIGSIAISGVAYAGDRGIKRVEVQVGAGTPWQAATLQAVDAVSTWAAWRYTWLPAKAGSYQISVRATDGTGTLQEAKAQDSFPLGATGLHTITVQVH